jgi:hypothetical protein
MAAKPFLAEEFNHRRAATLLEPKRSRRPLAWKATLARSSDLDGGPIGQQAKAESEKTGVSFGWTSARLRLIRVEVAAGSN